MIEKQQMITYYSKQIKKDKKVRPFDGKNLNLLLNKQRENTKEQRSKWVHIQDFQFWTEISGFSSLLHNFPWTQTRIKRYNEFTPKESPMNL